MDENKFLFDNIQGPRFQNRTLPKWITPEIEEFSSRYIFYRLQAETRTLQMQKLRSAIIHSMINNMERFAENNGKNETTKHQTKFRLYSGHDRTLITILNILKVSNYQRPSYTNALFVELHKNVNNEDFDVQIYYRNHTHEEPNKLQITGCQNNIDEPCLLRRFKNLIKPLIPKDCRQERQLNGFESISSQLSFGLSLLTIINGMTAFLCF